MAVGVGRLDGGALEGWLCVGDEAVPVGTGVAVPEAVREGVTVSVGLGLPVGAALLVRVGPLEPVDAMEEDEEEPVGSGDAVDPPDPPPHAASKPTARVVAVTS